MIWVLVDMIHQRIDNLVEAARTRHAARVPAAVLSINVNVAGTQALVKIACDEAELQAVLTNPIRAAIIRVYTEADRAEAVALVSAEAWTGPEPGV